MKKAARLFLAALPIVAYVSLLACVGSPAATKVAGTWKAVNPRATNLSYTLVAAKDSISITAANSVDGSTIGTLKMKIKDIDEKTSRISGPIASSDGIYKSLTGTAVLNYQYDDTSQKGVTVLYVALSASSYPDFSPQLAFAKQ